MKKNTVRASLLPIVSTERFSCVPPRIFFIVLAFSLLTTSAMGAVFTVTKTADTGDGVCDSDCSLREAISAGNSVAGDDIINFDPSVFSTSQTITLGGAALLIAAGNNLQITGSGAGLLTVSGNNASPVLFVNGGATVTIFGVTIAKGFAGSGAGGGIKNSGVLTLDNTVVTLNSAATSGFGGGIHNDGGSLLIKNSTVSNNTAGRAGGILSTLAATTGETLTIVDSLISGNRANLDLGGAIVVSGTLSITGSQIVNNTAQTNGGGLYFAEGPWPKTVENSTIASNFAFQNGGGAYNFRSPATFNNTFFTNNSVNQSGGGYYHSSTADATFTNSTLDGNSAQWNGGGILCGTGKVNVNSSLVKYNRSVGGAMGIPGEGGGGFYVSSGSTLNVTNSTITQNSAFLNGGGIFVRGAVNLVSATVTGNGGTYSGGINNFFNGPVTSRNSIIADNTAFMNRDFQGRLNSLGYNLIENLESLSISGVNTGNILGVDPQMAALHQNGGPTETIALRPGSPGIDAGDPANFPPADQRGVPRAQDGNLDGVSRPDIGAYERRIDYVFTVTKTEDTFDGVCDADCSLREAIGKANAALGDTLVSFDPVVFNRPQTITLTQGELLVANPVTLFIAGPGSNLLTVSGNNTSRIFYLPEAITVQISGMKATNGNGEGRTAPGEGGAILNRGYLVLDDVTVSENSALTKGGGIRSRDHGRIIINRSRISANRADRGGGIYVDDVSNEATINETLINDNTAATTGGGLDCTCLLTMARSTVSGNLAQTNGGGMYLPNSYGSIVNSTFSENRAVNGGGGYMFLTAPLTIESSTVSANSADGIGGGLVNGTTFTDRVKMRNTIIGDNLAGNHSPDYDGLLTSLGHNLIENTGGLTITGGPADIFGLDARLGPLVYNGGPTPTRALQPGSPAIDSADPAAFPATDQRGVARPKDGDGNGGAVPDRGAFERLTVERHVTPFDFDGDGKADISVFRPSDGNWYLLGSMIGYTGDHFGLLGDRVTPADYDGDGKTDLSVVRPNVGGYYWKSSISGDFYYTTFGQAGDLLAPADYDGDGRAELCFFRPSTGEWHLQDSYGGPGTIIQFGSPDDKPAIGDFDGDARADLSVFRPSTGEWRRIDSSTGALVVVSFGAAGDNAVPADYDGDGKTDIAVFRPSTGDWLRLNSGDGSIKTIHFGAVGDKPVPADFDGDGKADIGVFRPSDGNWYLLLSGSGYNGLHFGIGEDSPSSNAFVF